MQQTRMLVWLITALVSLLFELILLWKKILWKMPGDLKPPLRMIIICSSPAIFTSTTESWYFTSGTLFTRSEAGILVMINTIRQDLESRISVSEQQRSNAWRKVLCANWKFSSALLPVYHSLSSVLLCLLSPTKKRTSLSVMYSPSQCLIKTSVNTSACSWCRWISSEFWRKLNINSMSLLHIILHNNLLF